MLVAVEIVREGLRQGVTATFLLYPVEFARMVCIIPANLPTTNM